MLIGKEGLLIMTVKEVSFYMVVPKVAILFIISICLLVVTTTFYQAISVSVSFESV
jgi:hypothetical protein